MPANLQFNEMCYLARYPDLSNNGWMYKSSDGTWKYGNPSHRETRRLTDTGNAFWHWQNFGLAEGRVCGCDLPGTNYSNEFNSAAYLARYPDVRGTAILNSAFSGNPLGHYQTIGILQGRHPGFEILTSASPVGMVSPGTTTLIMDNPKDNQAPGDGEIILPPPVGGGDDAAPPVLNDNQPADISTWIAANPAIVAAAAGVLILLLSKKKKRKR